MKYLFIDFECSNCYDGGKICEFGYVLTDDKFSEIKTVDRPIAPGKKKKGMGRFDKKINQREPGFEFAYDIDTYFNSPEFPYFYPILKSLFTDSNIQVFGWSFSNDMNYLNYTCNRYHRNTFNFKCIDVTVFMNKYRETHPDAVNVHSLEETYKYFYSEEEFKKIHAHKASDDSFMTYKVLVKILENLKTNLNDLVKQCPSSIIEFDSVIKQIEENKAKREARKLAYNRWHRVCSACRDDLEKEEFKGKRVTISSNLRKDINVLNTCIDRLRKKGYTITSKIALSDMILVENEEDKDRLLSVFQEPYNGKFIYYSDLK